MNPKKDEGLLLRYIILLWRNSFQCSGVTRITSEAEFMVGVKSRNSNLPEGMESSDVPKMHEYAPTMYCGTRSCSFRLQFLG
jgi:hypothetical protein